jgi:hypothetical protein
MPNDITRTPSETVARRRRHHALDGAATNHQANRGLSCAGRNHEGIEMTETPTEQLTAAAQTKVLVTDARGRVIAVHKLSLLNYYAIAKAMGESASNPTLMDIAITAAAVRRIDTTDFAMPRTERDVEFLMQLLDFDGIKAAGDGLRQLNPPKDNEETSKNSHGSQPSV